MLCSGVVACQRNVVVERETNTPPVLQSSPSEHQAEQPSGNSQQLPPGHPSVGDKGAAAAVAITVRAGEIQKVKGGVTIQELYAQKGSIAGKSIQVRGKVVKYNAGILGKNWLHIKDGTGAEGENDLTITTQQEASLNQVIVVSGPVQFNKNIGSGYVFPAIIEDAKLAVEK